MNETKATGGGGGGSSFLKIAGFGCGGCLVLILVILLAGYSQLPTEYNVERSIVIAAPMEVVFPLVDTPAKWSDWDPWSKKDPGMEREYKGPPVGVGSESHWDSENEDVGTGMFRITESVTGQRVVLALEFKKPMESTSTGTFTFAEAEDGVHVSWADHGELSGAMRFFGFVADTVLGAMFEEGLDDLKALAEAEGGPGEVIEETIAETIEEPVEEPIEEASGE